MASPRRPRGAGLALPVAVVAVWELLTATGVIGYEYLPAPSEIATTLWGLVLTGELPAAVAHTLSVALLAAGISTTLGAAAGLAIGLVPSVGRYAVGTIDYLRVIPAVTLAPLALLTFGPTTATEVMVAVYAALWPVVLTTASGVAAVHPCQYDVARTLRLSDAAAVRKIVVPAAVPGWLVGARIAAVIGLLVAIVTEMIMYARGLGGGLVESLNALAPARMWAYAVTCAVIGYALNAALRTAVGHAMPGGGDPGRHIAGPPMAMKRGAPVRGLLPIAVLLIGWQLVGRTDSLSFPPPRDWLAALARLHRDGVLAPALGQTLTTYALGLALAAVVGTAAGAAIGASPRLDRLMTPSIDFVAAVPAAALVPLVVLLLGPRRLSGVAVVAVIVSWPVLLNTAAAMRAVPVVRLEMSRTLGLGPVARWRKVILPSLAPGVMLGMRVASALALIATLLVDIFGTGAGIGRLLIESQQRFDAAAGWGLLLVMGTIGYLTSAALAGRRRRSPRVPDYSMFHNDRRTVTRFR